MHNLLATIALALALLTVVASAQERFVDDAGRSVVLPARVSRVFAAGAPAEVMLYTLAPEQLVGRNRTPAGEALEFFPPAYRSPTLIRRLPEVDDAAADAELVALEPHLYIDYGTIDSDYVAAVDAVQRRTGVPGLILNGELTRVPDAYRRLGAVLGIRDRGERLAIAADRLMTKYRNSLRAGSRPVRVYLACSADGYVPCLEGDSAGEQLQWLGGINVAGTRANAPQRPLTIDEITAMMPDVVVVTGSLERFRSDPVWRQVAAVAAGRLRCWYTMRHAPSCCTKRVTCGTRSASTGGPTFSRASTPRRPRHWRTRMGPR